MKAGVLYAQGDLRYEEFEKPVAQAGEVLVKVKYTGICGSDVPRVNGTASHYYPNIFGHEFSGTVEQVADDVEGIRVGARVVGVPLVPCMVCEDCIRGNYALCRHYSFIGSRRFGSFAEYIALPSKNVVVIDDTVDFKAGAFFEPSTVALHGLERTGYQGGKTVAILGGGTIGMFTLQWAKIFGAKQVAVFDILDERLELGKKLGADKVFNTLNANFKEQVDAFTGGKGFDYVYETAGSIPTTKMAFDLVANKGWICYIGTPTKEVTFTVDQWEKINRKEMHITGSWMSYSAPFPGHEWDLTAHYFANGALKVDESFIDRVVGLSKIADAFDLFKVPGEVRGKILIDSEA